MNIENIKKIFGIVLIILVLFTFVPTNTYALTSDYAGSDGVEIKDKNSDSVLDKVGNFIQDLLLGALGKAIAAIGWVVEFLCSIVVGLLTGTYKFPWADKIIFNSMALLDVNFINPSKGSLFMDSKGGFTLIGNTVRNIYFTGLSIGLGFFGIMVAVMAIRIALSSIASEKAKYKEAVVAWMTALVLLFGLHYIISFVFYINEQLTEVAGNIVNNLITSSSGSKSISDLGGEFKSVAFGTWNTDSFIAAILYCVFIVQSLMFFYAYIKRLFFVVILAIIGPFVVVYDFLRKAIM